MGSGVDPKVVSPFGEMAWVIISHECFFAPFYFYKITPTSWLVDVLWLRIANDDAQCLGFISCFRVSCDGKKARTESTSQSGAGGAAMPVSALLIKSGTRGHLAASAMRTAVRDVGALVTGTS
jgi:hypothetical protein